MKTLENGDVALTEEEFSTEKNRMYYLGKQDGALEFSRQLIKSIELDQLRAATQLLHEAGRMMTRAGYMVDKVNRKQR